MMLFYYNDADRLLAGFFLMEWRAHNRERLILSNNEIMKKTGLDRYAVKKSLEKLIDLGIIRKIYANGKAKTTYTMP